MQDENKDPRTSAELEAEAYEHDSKAAHHHSKAAQLRADAVRLRALEHKQQHPPSIAKTTGHMKRSEYAHSRGVSDATVTRWVKDGMPTIPVGTTDRIDPAVADEWRRTRPRRATTAAPAKKSASPDDVDVSDLLKNAGLTEVRRAR